MQFRQRAPGYTPLTSQHSGNKLPPFALCPAGQTNRKMPPNAFIATISFTVAGLTLGLSLPIALLHLKTV